MCIRDRLSKATGSLSILVPVGAALPDAPNPSEIQLTETRYEAVAYTHLASLPPT